MFPFLFPSVRPTAERRCSSSAKIAAPRFNPLDAASTPRDPDAQWTSHFLGTPNSARTNPSYAHPEPHFQTTSGEILPYSQPTVPDPACIVPHGYDFFEPSLPEPHSPFSVHLLPSLPPSRTPTPEPITMASFTQDQLTTLMQGIAGIAQQAVANAIAQVPAPAPPPVPVITLPRELRIAAPNKFEFKSSYTVYDFLPACEAVFDHHSTMDNNTKLRYAMSFMEGAPLMWARSHLEAMTDAECAALTWDTFKASFLVIFGDSDRHLKAMTKIRNLRQRGSAAHYEDP
ncbi:hypothetical protein BOTBODRAFT_181504 [Botryobasidium botryosum FD-172 SS1]|uniref:Retrotransposon gag domain-containing protein n=1 Tax=Botryobasidium botryosum (strain FD-172 SS1) TaxID=930990 RepID=A0A067LTC2_BOTB1|nr:hypothetical protein BOTBODRAFT_181504 [Botryobasidium botryosum FD-172 SS1]